MKSLKIISVLILTAALAGAVCNSALGADKEKNLEAKAKIPRADAEKTALAKVPHGTIKEGELEEEKGKLIWSFDIATPGTKDITEVNVDAVTGAVISVDVEKPADEAKEAKDEAKEKKGKKAEKDADEKEEKK